MKPRAFPFREVGFDPGTNLCVPGFKAVAAGETKQLFDRIVPGRGEQAIRFLCHRGANDGIRVG